MAVKPRGFVPLRSLGGPVSFTTRRYRVSSGNTTSIFPGDAVRLLADGQVRRVRTSAATVAELGVLGVVRNVLNSNGRPLTFSQPTNGPFLNASTAGYVDVYDDPDIVYQVNGTTSASAAYMGRFCRVTAATYNSAAGISGLRIETADVTSSAVGHQFQIIGIAPSERIGSLTVDGESVSSADLEVRIANHTYRRVNGLVGGGTV